MIGLGSDKKPCFQYLQYKFLDWKWLQSPFWNFSENLSNLVQSPFPKSAKQSIFGGKENIFACSPFSVWGCIMVISILSWLAFWLDPRKWFEKIMSICPRPFGQAFTPFPPPEMGNQIEVVALHLWRCFPQLRCALCIFKTILTWVGSRAHPIRNCVTSRNLFS